MGFRYRSSLVGFCVSLALLALFLTLTVRNFGPESLWWLLFAYLSFFPFYTTLGYWEERRLHRDWPVAYRLFWLIGSPAKGSETRKLLRARTIKHLKAIMYGGIVDDD